MTQVPPAQIKSELDKVSREVARITGQQMRFMRPPRGIFSDRMLGVCREFGYTNVFWSVAYRDWETSRQMGANYAYTNVVNQLHPGAVILLHSVSRDNAQALGRIIDEAKARGYEFKRLDALEMKVYR